jgi:hypothetical protein
MGRDSQVVEPAPRVTLEREGWSESAACTTPGLVRIRRLTP